VVEHEALNLIPSAANKERKIKSLIKLGMSLSNIALA
jgi:hypothetical protein